MSGRLIILSKKTWHPWRQDNQERVLRDERLHREGEAEKAEKQRAVEREQRLDLLRKRKRGEAVEEPPPSPPEVAAAREEAADKDEEGVEDEDAVAAGAKRGLDNAGLKIPKSKEGYVEGARHEGHVHLFGDVADSLVKKARNADYEKEKAAKELGKKRVEGIAPWGFDDVKAPCKPWYERGAGETAPAMGRGGRVLEEEEAERQRRRAERAKDSVDPMNVFLPPPKQGPAHRGGSRWGPPGGATTVAATATAGVGSATVEEEEAPSLSSSSSFSSESSTSGSSGEERRRRRQRKKEKRRKSRDSDKDKKDKKKSRKKKTKKKKEKEKDRGKSKSKASVTTTASASASATAAAGGVTASSSMEALRQRRLERERTEHRRAVRLLAERQMAGLSYPGGATPLIESEREPEVEMDDRIRDYNSRFYRRDRRGGREREERRARRR